MIFFFIARVALIAIVFAAIMTVAYGAFKGIKNMFSYDRNGEAYYTRRHEGMGMGNYHSKGVEPLFDEYPAGRMRGNGTRYVETF